MMSRRRDARRSSTRAFLAMVALLALAARPVAAAAFEPACAALASATAPALKIDNTPHVFDRVNDYVYVRADVTTSATLSGWQSIFVWGGGDGVCGVTGAAGMLFGISEGKIFLGRQCESPTGFYFLPLAAFEPAASARFVVEVYYRAQTDELRIWVDGVEVTPTGTTYALEWSDGYASAGYGKHYAAETWGGTIHAIDFYECAWLKSAVDNCIAATINPDLTLYPSCVAPAVPSGSGRFCCSLCGANCLHGGATDMPNWDVSEVTSFEGLFQDKTSFDEDLSSWDVSSVTNMERTFLGATAFNSPIGDWNVASVTTMDSMFQDASAFDANITGWSSPQSSQNMFLGATAFLAKFANCNNTATPIDPNACRRKSYPPSLAAFDGPPAAWDNRHCDFSASVVANGALGECNSSDVPKGSMCAPTCGAASALAMKGLCGHEKQTPPACVCECKDKRAAFGFVVEQ